MLGYLASQPEAAVVCGVVSEPEERSSGGLDGVGETFQAGGGCFYRSRRVTTLEPQHTLAAVSGGAERVILVGVRG